MRSSVKVGFFVGLLVLGGWIYRKGYFEVWFTQSTKQIQTIFPAYRDITFKKFFSGKLIPKKTIQVESHIFGVVDQVFVHIGDTIKKGAPIVRIRLRPSADQAEEQATQVRLAAIALTKAKKRYASSQVLFKKKMLAKEMYEQDFSAWKEAREKWQLAQKKLEILKGDGIKSQADGDNVIRAMATGTILDLPVKEGGAVAGSGGHNSGTVLATIADTTQFLFTAQVSELDVVGLRRGMAFTVTLNANKEEKFQVRLTKIALQANKQLAEKGEVRFDIEGVLLNQQKSSSILRSGYVALAEVVIHQEHHVLSISESLVHSNQDGYFVNCLQEGKHVEKKVVLGISDGFYVQVKEGLEITDQLIIES